ncbi:MAG: hypothetical protein ACOX2F_12885 [bacterium]
MTAAANLFSTKPTKFIEDNVDTIIKRWLNIVLQDKATLSFSNHHLEELEQHGRRIIGHLRKWISYETTPEEIGTLFADRGTKLFKMGIPLCEALRAVMLLRTTTIKYVREQLVFDNSFELQILYDLVSKMAMFFDRAHYHITRGYMEEMHTKMKSLVKISDKDAEKIFFDRSFYKKEKEES